MLKSGTFGIFPANMVKGRSPNEQVVLAWIWRHVNADTGTCFPALNTLASECGCSKPTVIKAIKALVAAGLLVKNERTKAGSCERDSNLYQVVIDVDHPSKPALPPVVSDVDSNNNHSNNNHLSNGESTIDAEIEKVYQAYPYKDVRFLGCKAIRKQLQDGASSAEMLAGIERYKKFIAAERQRGFDRKYKGCAAWFNSKMWEGEWTIQPAIQKTGFEPQRTVVYKP